MVLSLNQSRRASLRQALLYARETFALMPAHWLRPGVVADIETFLDELAPPDTDRKRDWRGLIHYGASFFLLEKMGAVVGVSNLHIYAAMRGQTLEAFQQTRNQQVTYSVAGKR